MKRVVVAFIVATALLIGGCERNTLCYEHVHGGVMLDVQWDSIPEDLVDDLPESVGIMLYRNDSNSGTNGNLLYTYYRNTHGGNISVADGNYNYIVFNSDTEMIQLRGMENFETAEAYLAERSRTPYDSKSSNKHIAYAAGSRANATTRGESLIREPDRFFATYVGEKNITTASNRSQDTIRVYPVSRVLFMNVEVNVKGLEGARSCRASLSGIARSICLHCYDRGTETGTLIFDMDKSDEACIMQNICVFGLNQSSPETPPEEKVQHLLTLEFVMKDNQVSTHEFDIGEQIDFDNQQPEMQIPISLPEEIELPEVKSPESGFDAGIEGWGDQVDIYL